MNLSKERYFPRPNGRISPNFCRRPLTSTSSQIREESFVRNVPRICLVHQWNLERRHDGYCTREEFWKGDIWVADFEELEILGAAETRVRILNAKEVMTPTDGHKIILLVEDGQVKPLGGDQVLRTSTSLQDLPEGAPGDWSQERSARGEMREDLRGESDGSQPVRLISG